MKVPQTQDLGFLTREQAQELAGGGVRVHLQPSGRRRTRAVRVAHARASVALARELPAMRWPVLAFEGEDGCFAWELERRMYE